MKQVFLYLLIGAISISTSYSQEAVTPEELFRIRALQNKDERLRSYDRFADLLSIELDKQKASVEQYKKKEPLVLVNWETATRSADYREYLDLTLTLKNNSSETLTAIKLQLSVISSLNEYLQTLSLVAGDCEIEPGAEVTFTWSYDDNRYMSDEPYDTFTTYAKRNLTIGILEQTVATLN